MEYANEGKGADLRTLAVIINTAMNPTKNSWKTLMKSLGGDVPTASIDMTKSRQKIKG